MAAKTAVQANDETHNKAESRDILTNPFQPGDRVIIPAGTTYVTANPTIKGRHRSKRAVTVVVEEAYPAFLVRTANGRVLSRPPRIRTTGSGGYDKNINITEQIVVMNGNSPVYESVSVEV